MAEKIYIEIVTPEKILYQGEITRISAPGAYGEFQALPEHAPFFTSLEIGKMYMDTADGENQWAAVHGGYFQIMDNRATVLADNAELAEEIDLERVEQAKARAQERLQQWSDSSRDDKGVMRAEMALMRALVREEVVYKQKEM